MAPETSSAAAKAAADVPSHSAPAIVKPHVMATAAPKLAADVMPKVDGLASAFPVIV